MVTKTDVKRMLKTIANDLNSCRISIAELNENGKQFDYCTDDELSNVVDRCNAQLDNITKIVYQETK